MTYIRLFNAMLKKQLIILKRYWFNTLGSLLTFYLVFLLMFLGYSGFAGGTPGFEQNLEGLIVGYLLWVFAIYTYQEISNQTLTEAREGTLEQMYMSPFSYTLLAGFKLISSFVVQFVFVGLLLLVIQWTTGRHISIDFISFLPLLVLTMTGIAGLGFMLGGLALIFKRIQSYMQITQFILVAFVAAPVGAHSVLALLPASLGSHLIREVLVAEVSFLALPALSLIGLVVNALFYLIVGIFIFNLCEKKAMKEGLLGHY